ncbi:MAG TPA: DUF3592 domain-containing protein [Actinomycetes bacterium]
MGSAAGILMAVGAVFAALGAGFVAIGLRTRRSSRAFMARAARVPGLVVDLELHRGRYHHAGDVDSGVWVPRLEFTTVDGRPVQTLAMYGSVPAPARRGDQVMVLYDPDQPTRAQVADRKLASGGCLSAAMLVAGTGALLFGLLFVAIGAAVLLNS